MPELPEVETYRILAESRLRGQVLRDVWVMDDALVFGASGAARVRDALEGRAVVAVERHGKQLWWRLDRGPHPRFQFAMTGGFVAQGATPLALSSGVLHHGDGWPPARTRMTVSTERGHLAFVTTRRLARVFLEEAPWDAGVVLGLGADPVHALPCADRLAEGLAGRRGSIKGTLLGQSVVAGLGNWLVDEILHAAGVDPRRQSATLTRAEVVRIRAAIDEVVGLAVDVEADARRFPETWLFHLRWGAPVAWTRDGAPLEFTTVAGRRTLVVQTRQR